MQTLTPQMVSLRNQYAFSASSLSRFSNAGLLDVVERERARNRAKREAGETLTPRDMVHLRAALDILKSSGIDA